MSVISFTAIVLSVFLTDLISLTGREEPEQVVAWSKYPTMNLAAVESSPEVYSKKEKVLEPFRWDMLQKPKLESILPSKKPEPLPRLIKLERKLAEADPANPVAQKLELPYSTMLYAKLVLPVYSQDIGTEIHAALSRPLHLSGKLIVPIDTRIRGQISTVSEGRIYFKDEFELFYPDGTVRILQAQLQENRYDVQSQHYGMTDGRLGLPARRVEPSVEPVAGKLMKEVGAVAKDIAAQQVQLEARQYLPTAGIRDPRRLLEELESKATQPEQASHYYISTGTEFYLFVR